MSPVICRLLFKITKNNCTVSFSVHSKSSRIKLISYYTERFLLLFFYLLFKNKTRFSPTKNNIAIIPVSSGDAIFLFSLLERQ